MKQRSSVMNGIPTRKEEVIRVAERLFAVKGYHATTLDEIAEEIGVTKPALYYYINSKEDILRSIINRILEPMNEVIQVGESYASPREKMARIIRILVKFSAERKETTLIAFEQAKLLPKRSSDVLKRRQEEVEKVVENILKEGMEKNIFYVTNTRMACFAILSVANWVYRWYQPGKMTPDEIADHFINLLENGYVKPEHRT